MASAAPLTLKAAENILRAQVRLLVQHKPAPQLQSAFNNYKTAWGKARSNEKKVNKSPSKIQQALARVSGAADKIRGRFSRAPIPVFPPNSNLNLTNVNAYFKSQPNAAKVNSNKLRSGAKKRMFGGWNYGKPGSVASFWTEYNAKNKNLESKIKARNFKTYIELGRKANKNIAKYPKHVEFLTKVKNLPGLNARRNALLQKKLGTGVNDIGFGKEQMKFENFTKSIDDLVKEYDKYRGYTPANISVQTLAKKSISMRNQKFKNANRNTFKRLANKGLAEYLLYKRNAAINRTAYPEFAKFWNAYNKSEAARRLKAAVEQAEASLGVASRTNLTLEQLTEAVNSVTTSAAEAEEIFKTANKSNKTVQAMRTRASTAAYRARAILKQKTNAIAKEKANRVVAIRRLNSEFNDENTKRNRKLIIANEMSRLLGTDITNKVAKSMVQRRRAAANAMKAKNNANAAAKAKANATAAEAAATRNIGYKTTVLENLLAKNVNTMNYTVAGQHDTNVQAAYTAYTSAVNQGIGKLPNAARKLIAEHRTKFNSEVKQVRSITVARRVKLVANKISANLNGKTVNNLPAAIAKARVNIDTLPNGPNRTRANEAIKAAEAKLAANTNAKKIAANKEAAAKAAAAAKANVITKINLITKLNTTLNNTTPPATAVQAATKARTDFKRYFDEITNLVTTHKLNTTTINGYENINKKNTAIKELEKKAAARNKFVIMGRNNFPAGMSNKEKNNAVRKYLAKKPTLANQAANRKTRAGKFGMATVDPNLKAFFAAVKAKMNAEKAARDRIIRDIKKVNFTLPKTGPFTGQIKMARSTRNMINKELFRANLKRLFGTRRVNSANRLVDEYWKNSISATPASSTARLTGLGSVAGVTPPLPAPPSGPQAAGA